MRSRHFLEKPTMSYDELRLKAAAARQQARHLPMTTSAAAAMERLEQKTECGLVGTSEREGYGGFWKGRKCPKHQPKSRTVQTLTLIGRSIAAKNNCL
jgi:hypothetical protein